MADENDTQEVSLDSVFCRLEMKEMDEVCEKRESLYETLLEGMKMQYSITNGQIATAKKKKLGELLTLREFGLIITRIGLEAIRAHEEGDEDEDEYE